MDFKLIRNSSASRSTRSSFDSSMHRLKLATHCSKQFRCRSRVISPWLSAPAVLSILSFTASDRAASSSSILRLCVHEIEVTST